jgi:NAD(P)-dependent dehydrogenase (short-subunit alcohol dehydrogenase family)
MEIKIALKSRYVEQGLSNNHMDTLKEKVVLITGAGKGSGRILAKAFAERGSIVAANDISPINVEEVVRQIHAKGGRAKAYIEDVAKKVGVQNIINQVEDDFGRIDILIHHAAVEPHVPLLDMDEWDWHRVLDVNLTGAFLMTQSVGRVMRAQGAGVIIHLITKSSRAEGNPRAPEKDYPGTARQGWCSEWRERSDQSRSKAAFIASMNGLEAFARQAACELSPHGIRVVSVENFSETIVEQVFALFDQDVEQK